MAAIFALTPVAVKGFSTLPAGSSAARKSSACKFNGLTFSRRNMMVRCGAQPEEKAAAPASAPVVPPPSSSLPVKGPATVMDVFSFGGTGPETINGRLAMVGFVTALAVEAATGAPLSRQIASGGSISWFVFAVSLFSAASLVPLFQGITPESRSGGFFTSKAETLNGRAAMIGLMALYLTEYVKGSPLV